MKRYTAFVALVACIGCAGGGGSSSAPSQFAGTWSGTWTSPTLGQNGTTNLTVGTNGLVTGTMFNQQTGDTGTLTGLIRSTGQTTANGQYPGEPQFFLSGTVTKAGTNMTGNLTQTAPGFTGAVTVDLDLQ